MAIRWLGRDGDRRDLSYADLAEHAARFANVLSDHGLKRSDRVFGLLGRVPELYAAALGTLKAGLTFTPLFAAFGPEPIRARMEIGEANALVTTAGALPPQDAPMARADSVAEARADRRRRGAGRLRRARPGAAAKPRPISRRSGPRPRTTALIHFTSGTTGRPKGAVHVHDAVVMHAMSGRFALDLHPGDIYWCTADPGWVTGTSYGIIAPLVNRVTMIVDEADFDLDRWYGILEREKVQVWYTAPTAIRMMMRAGNEAAQGHDFSHLRFMASVGEPLNPEAVVWGQEVFGRPFHDNWWQTETGGIMIANTAAMDIKPGSMGKPLPGIEAGHRRARRQTAFATAGRRDRRAGAAPRLAVDDARLPPRAGALRQVLRRRLVPVRRPRDARRGRLLLVRRPRRRPDQVLRPPDRPVRGRKRADRAPGGGRGRRDRRARRDRGRGGEGLRRAEAGLRAVEELEREIRGHARKRLGPAVAPREIVFRKTLPKTRSGKIMRRLLKARELGLPEGDISTLETDET